MDIPREQIKAIIGLGNPGPRFHGTRHNIGFMVVDALAERYHGSWQHKDEMELAQIQINGYVVLLIKPQTFMNASGRVIPFLQKKGIRAENLIVVHDELEKPFGSLALKMGGSARGHNGLRSIIELAGPDFLRLRFGIGRPKRQEEVSDYVLQRFEINRKDLMECVEEAVILIEDLFIKKET
jgi:PTH1 family peptidyl-tRNA hydrolase